MQLDRWLAIIGLVIGLPSFFLLFGYGVALALMGVVLCVGLFGAAGWVRYRISLPPYSYELIVTHVKIEDSTGRSAKMSKKYKGHPNYGHLDFVTHRNIAADGDITDFRWNNNPIDKNCIECHLGEYIVTVRFGACLAAFKTFTGELSYKLHDSFPADTESLIWVADFPTTIAILKVSLPDDRPCTSVSGHISIGGTQKPLTSINTSNENRHIELKIKRPKVGAEYEIVWNW